MLTIKDNKLKRFEDKTFLVDIFTVDEIKSIHTATEFSFKELSNQLPNMKKVCSAKEYNTIVKTIEKIRKVSDKIDLIMQAHEDNIYNKEE